MSSAARHAIRSLAGKVRRVAKSRPTSRRSCERMPPATSTTLTTLVARGPVARRACNIQSLAPGSPRRCAMSTSESRRITVRDAHCRGVGNAHRHRARENPRHSRARRRNLRWRRDPIRGRRRSDRGLDRSTDGSELRAKSPALGQRRRVNEPAPRRGRYSFYSYTRLYTSIGPQAALAKRTGRFRRDQASLAKCEKVRWCHDYPTRPAGRSLIEPCGAPWIARHESDDQAGHHREPVRIESFSAHHQGLKFHQICTSAALHKTREANEVSIETTRDVREQRLMRLPRSFFEKAA
jgi:hypothetical protein